ncbi:Protein kinase domain [Arabidopsis thaliana x Arabidopsis arenosa]|uniref:Protein kinase domain n=1 Tax=Arabidopsis thaliana x Arabidopsis arenosa TaxID=1240361 RepID=A0A8T2A669_9BRAS|nr:Protein kinase domain [Arabidopsis thaliana x Arabidopsis arenosa]
MASSRVSDLPHQRGIAGEIKSQNVAWKLEDKTGKFLETLEILSLWQQVKRREGKYEVGRTIGEGTFAKVKFARNSETGEPVALKILDKDKVLKHKMAEQIRREIATMKLIKHPNVVLLYEVVMASKTKIFIILEYVTGGELFDKIVNDGRMKENEARRYFQQLIHAVDYCHSRGVYHRDLKSVVKRSIKGPLNIDNNYLPTINLILKQETRVKGSKALPFSFLTSRSQTAMGELKDASTAQQTALETIIADQQEEREQTKSMVEEIREEQAKIKETMKVEKEEVINKIQSLGFVFGVDAGEEEREAAFVSKLQRKNDISEGRIMSRENSIATHSGGPWAKRTEGKERWHHLTDGGGEWTVRQIGHVSEEDKLGSWMGDSKISSGEFSCPPWLSLGAMNLITRILDPNLMTVNIPSSTKSSYGSSIEVERRHSRIPQGMNRRQQVKRIVGKYEVGRTIGEGTFAKVKFARNSETGEPVALKILDKDKVLKHKMAEQIRREIATMKLIKHPNVVLLYEVVMASKTKIFIILEYVTGGELFDKIVNDGRMKENEARRYFQQLIHAVDYCHSRGVYHRDLKSVVKRSIKGPLNIDNNYLPTINLILKQETRVKGSKALPFSFLTSRSQTAMGELKDASTAQQTALETIIADQQEEREQTKSMVEEIREEQAKIKETMKVEKEEVINKIQSLGFVFGVDAGEEEREAAFVSKLQRKNDISEGRIMSRENSIATHSGGPWAKRTEGKERWHHLTDGGGEWTVRQIGHVSEEDKLGSWMGDSKMEFSTYDGSTNAIEWLQKCEDYFDDQGIYNDDTKVPQATFVLTGNAYHWHNNLRRLINHRLCREEFKKICKIRFGRADTINPIGELSNLRHTGTKDEYCEQFKECLGRQTKLKGEQQLRLFCAGLTDSLRKEVEYLRPKTIFKAMEYARDNEYKIECDKRVRTFGGHTAPTACYSAPISKPMLSGYRGSSSVAEKLGIPIRRRPDGVVALADGGKCPVDSLCKGISMTVQGHQFEGDCFAIPLSGFDVVLGISSGEFSCPPWLSLGAMNLITRILDPNLMTVNIPSSTKSSYGSSIEVERRHSRIPQGMNRRQQVKRIVGKYEVGRTIGEGTFAKVKFARNSETGEPVALKILDKDKVLKHKMAEQIRKEIATMKLIKHPNVVQLYEVVMASKTKIFIILEYVTGGELFDKIVNDGRMKEYEARRYFQQLIHAVDYPHSRDGEDPEDEPMDDEDLKLSLNAMKGEHNESTIQVNANIDNGSGWILLDTRSIHNFIRSSVAEKLGIPIQRRPDRVVALADGGKCPVDGLCHQSAHLAAHLAARQSDHLAGHLAAPHPSQLNAVHALQLILNISSQLILRSSTQFMLRSSSFKLNAVHVSQLNTVHDSLLFSSCFAIHSSQLFNSSAHASQLTHRSSSAHISQLKRRSSYFTIKIHNNLDLKCVKFLKDISISIK